VQGQLDDAAEDLALARRIGAPGGAPGARADHAAETLLCKRLFPRIRAYGLRHLRQEAAAADLAQQVLFIVIEALRARRVEEPERLAAFVMGTCRNTVLTLQIGELRRAELLEVFGHCLVSAGEPDEAVLPMDKLAACLDHLPARERAIVALTYYVGREGDEIARELAMTPGNVRVARHRALKHLHECLTGGES
jgi:RNA polymerase sigma-70 factor (ECF subfamily)